MDSRVVFFWSNLQILLLLCFLPTPSLAQSVGCHKDDYTALMKIKAALHNPDHLASWLPNTDCCNWLGVSCDRSNDNRVNRLILSDADISGQIPSEVGDLPYLYELTFHHLTNLNGHIPSTVTKLKHLGIMTFIDNKLSGRIPSFLAQLPSLLFIDLSFNQFTGSIPSSLSNHNILRTLILEHNKLSGKIPESFANNFPNSTVYVDLSHNNLHGRLPKSLKKVDFDSISLSGNKFQGDASMLFRANGSTYRITLSNNKFAFDLSKVEIPSNLKNLEISHNKIFGSIPEGLTGLKLKSLNVSYNRLSGKIPQGGNVQSFSYYNFYHNRGLCGSPLPACK